MNRASNCLVRPLRGHAADRSRLELIARQRLLQGAPYRRIREQTCCVEDRILPRTDVWIERLVVRGSQIEGRGLAFTDGLPAGTVVLRLGGRLISSLELDALIRRADADPEVAYVDTVTVYEDAHLVLPPNTPIHFANHSCDPTMWHVGPYEVATRRDVIAGEEATIDYGTVSGAEGSGWHAAAAQRHAGAT